MTGLAGQKCEAERNEGLFKLAPRTVKAKTELCGYKAIPVGVRGMVQGHTERDHGGKKGCTEL
jgi:hypothetical protein